MMPSTVDDSMASAPDSETAGDAARCDAADRLFAPLEEQFKGCLGGERR